jgi:4-oxalocrotonate tautomerase
VTLKETALPIVTIPFTREVTAPARKPALKKAAANLLADVLTRPRPDFVVIQEAELQPWGVGGLPAAEHRRQSAAGSPG